MIKKIRQTELDKKYLSLNKYIATPMSIDFTKIVVDKPWGHEYLMHSTPEIELWNLFIRHQRSTSMHCHPNKKTALLVIKGRTIFSTLNESWELQPYDSVIIDSGVFHSSESISKDGARVLEFETPPMKHDLVRLQDKYGRANTTYENDKRMRPDAQYETQYARFFGKESEIIHDAHNNKMYIKRVMSKNDIMNIQNPDTTLAVLLGGSIKSEIGEPLYLPPNVLTIEELQDLDCVFDNLSVFIIEGRK